MNIPCILIPALVGLICGILGYLLGKMNSKSDDITVSLQSELDACRANSKKLSIRISELEGELANAKLNVSKTIQSFAAPLIVFNADLAASIYGKKIKENDLKVIEGIGPKIEDLFHKAGITTWLALSETATDKLQAILNAEGEAYSVHNPGTWSRQAKLAYEGKWQELKDWQDALDGGKE
ncbi:hypothetical protein [Flavobacterium adhaerens]|uniref:hypothetical protein n=1 Tax=Flavobacterium adhaerens TaxID=3149043 RepID=UPI0032B43A53